jgi:hypothetical protein
MARTLEVSHEPSLWNGLWIVGKPLPDQAGSWVIYLDTSFVFSFDPERSRLNARKILRSLYGRLPVDGSLSQSVLKDLRISLGQLNDRPVWFSQENETNPGYWLEGFSEKIGSLCLEVSISGLKIVGLDPDVMDSVVLHWFHGLGGRAHLHELEHAVADPKKGHPLGRTGLSPQDHLGIEHSLKIMDRGFEIPTLDADVFNGVRHWVIPLLKDLSVTLR